MVGPGGWTIFVQAGVAQDGGGVLAGSWRKAGVAAALVGTASPHTP